MIRRALLGAVIALAAGWVLATAASGSSRHRVSAASGQPSELTSLHRACTPHPGDTVGPNRWTARRALVLHTARPVGRMALCRRIAV
jgi:hypothetical protein